MSAKVSCDPQVAIHSNSILPSFPRIRRQNLDVLYGNNDDNPNDGNHSIAVDKSRMGHVDPHIQTLVDYINQNSNFVTLSSCSGRIVLFHPKATLRNRIMDDHSEEPRVDDHQTNPIEGNVSGKGSTGSWVFVTHDVVDDPIATIVPFFFPMDTESSECASSVPNEDYGDSLGQLDDHQLCYFRFEPMLLHVAACNLEAGQWLLQVALQNGLRESGLVVTSHRVTVAFRTHSLALSVPLSFQRNHIFFPKSVEYVVTLTKELNRRLRLNLQLIQKVLSSLQQCFQSVTSPVKLLQDSRTSRQLTTVDATMGTGVVVTWEQQQSHGIPALNLYGHVVVELIYITEGMERREILVLGGYGNGPKLMQAPVTQQSKMRSVSLYCLRQELNLHDERNQYWKTRWETVGLVKIDKIDTKDNTTDKIQLFVHVADELHAIDTSHFGTMKVNQIDWDGRMYTSALNLTKVLNDVSNCIDNRNEVKTHILLFGGRYGPNKPMNDLILFVYNNCGNTNSGSMFIPYDIHGTKPTPRWGHTLTVLNHNSRGTSPSIFDPTIVIPVAVLIGGRHTHGNCTDPLYVLSIVPSHNDSVPPSQDISYHFLWEKIVTGNETLHHQLSRCFHTATMIDLNHVFVFGGLHHPEYLSEFDDVTQATNDDDNPVDSLLLTFNSKTSCDTNESFRVDMNTVNIPNISHRFAHSAINMQSSDKGRYKEMDEQKGIILLAGGVSQERNVNSITSDQQETKSTFLNCIYYEVANGNVTLNEIMVIGKNVGDAIDPGPMIEHCCIYFPRHTMDDSSSLNQHDVLFVGGGVSGFAFQELFAPSHHFLFQWNSEHLNCFNSDDVGDGNTLPISSSATTDCIGPFLSHPKTVEPFESNMIVNQLMICDVVYVLKQNAKVVKQYLELLEFINKQYRLTAIERRGIARWFQNESSLDGMNDDELQDYIAIPIRSQCMGLLRRDRESDEADTALTLIVGFGQQSCLPSTGTYARGNGRTK